MGALPKETIKKSADAMLDVVEDAVAASTTGVDDAVVLPIIDMIRRVFDIPDND